MADHVSSERWVEINKTQLKMAPEVMCVMGVEAGVGSEMVKSDRQSGEWEVERNWPIRI